MRPIVSFDSFVFIRYEAGSKVRSKNKELLKELGRLQLPATFSIN